MCATGVASGNLLATTLESFMNLRSRISGWALFALGAVAASGAAAQAPTPPLAVKVYNADAASFHVNAVTISGKSEVMVVDTGFTRADALRIAANVLDSGRTLKVILISNADPDYYFGAETLKGLFPQAQVLAASAVRKKIQANVAAKVAFWGPQMGGNAPKQPIVPEEVKDKSLSVDGEAVEIRGATGILAHRPYVWIPSIKAIVGNVALVGNAHVWTADTRTLAERQAWLAQLDEMLALKPSLVVPGHMTQGAALDQSVITGTRDYLQRFEVELARAPNAAALISVMQQAYPQAGLAVALDIGAKVNKGEMKW